MFNTSLSRNCARCLNYATKRLANFFNKIWCSVSERRENTMHVKVLLLVGLLVNLYIRVQERLINAYGKKFDPRKQFQDYPHIYMIMEWRRGGAGASPMLVANKLRLLFVLFINPRESSSIIHVVCTGSYISHFYMCPGWKKNSYV